MVAVAAGVLAAAAAALAAALVAALVAAPPVRAAPASASRVHGNDLRAPGDDSQPGPLPTTRRQTCIDVLCAYLRMPYEPDPGDLSHAGTLAP